MLYLPPTSICIFLEIFFLILSHVLGLFYSSKMGGQPNIWNRKRILLKPTPIALLQNLGAQFILGPDIPLFKQDV